MYRLDRFDREPIKLLVKLMFFGALSVLPVLIAEIILGTIRFAGITGLAYRAFVGVALVEEFFKWLVVILFAYRRPEFDEPLDGIVYCVFSALGFAAVENIMYVVGNYAVSPNIALYRGILSVPGHALFGVSMGYFMSLAKYATDRAVSARYMRRSLLVPIFFHGVYDFMLFVQTPLLLLLFIPFVIYMWVNGNQKIKAIRADIASQSQDGLALFLLKYILRYAVAITVADDHIGRFFDFRHRVFGSDFDICPLEHAQII